MDMGVNKQPNFPALLIPTRDRTVRAYGRLKGLAKGTGSRLRQTARRLVPGFSRPLRLVQRANRAAASDLDGFSGFTGSNGGWARTEYGEYYVTSVLGAQTAGME